MKTYTITETILIKPSAIPKVLIKPNSAWPPLSSQPPVGGAFGGSAGATLASRRGPSALWRAASQAPPPGAPGESELGENYMEN